MKNSTDSNYSDGVVSSQIINAKINDFNNSEVNNIFKNSTLLVDTTTTLSAPRDLSTIDNAPRMVSAFVTPIGLDSVLLMEDEDRCVRLSTLEAQYYRAILRNNTWGKNHLAKNSNELWIGAGCRDASFVISHELIQLHGAILARQIRQLSDSSNAKINIWCTNDDTGSVDSVSIPVHDPIINRYEKWSVSWDKGLQETLNLLRNQSLPNETGGILLGYFDQKMKTLFLVDALHAPLDSESCSTEFIRGCEGLTEALNICLQKTKGIVGYVGEWHSHPEKASISPSRKDIGLLAYLTEQMFNEGLPVLMAIVGDSGISFSLGEK